VSYMDAGYAAALVVLVGYGSVLVRRRRRLERWATRLRERRPT